MVLNQIYTLSGWSFAMDKELQALVPWYKLTGDAQIGLIGRISANNVHPSRILPTWVMGVVHAGERTIKVGENTGYAKVGDYFLLPPHQFHSGTDSDKHDVTFIHFTMIGEQANVPSQIDSGNIVLPLFGQLPKDTDLLRSFAYLYDQSRSELVDHRFLTIQLQAMLYQISFHMQKRQVLTDRNSRLGDDLFQFILTHLTGELSAELFEARFRLGYRQLNLIFRQQFKTTIRQKTKPSICLC
jgi:hypothetical protein